MIDHALEVEDHVDEEELVEVFEEKDNRMSDERDDDDDDDDDDNDGSGGEEEEDEEARQVEESVQMEEEDSTKQSFLQWKDGSGNDLKTITRHGGSIRDIARKNAEALELQKVAAADGSKITDFFRLPSEEIASSAASESIKPPDKLESVRIKERERAESFRNAIQELTRKAGHFMHHSAAKDKRCHAAGVHGNELYKGLAVAAYLNDRLEGINAWDSARSIAKVFFGKTDKFSNRAKNIRTWANEYFRENSILHTECFLLPQLLLSLKRSIEPSCRKTNNI